MSGFSYPISDAGAPPGRSRCGVCGLLAIVLAAIVAVPLPTDAQEGEDEERTIERILELERQIDELIAGLSPEARERLARRLAEAGGTDEPDSGESPQGDEPVEAPPAAAVVPPPPAPPVEPEVPVRRRLARRPGCNFLEVFDENQDGRVTSLDRYWRHLYLWSDADGDGQVQDGEVESVYARNIRELATDLTIFVRKKGSLGEVRVETYPRLDVRGDGFGGGDDGILVVDATRLKRGDGPDLRSATGDSLEGFQPFQAGQSIRYHEGQVVELVCP